MSGATSYVAAATGAIAGPVDAGVGNVIRQVTLRVNGPAYDSVVALETSPDGTTWTERDRVTGPDWAFTAGHFTAREARANVINLGTGGLPLSAVISYMT